MARSSDNIIEEAVGGGNDTIAGSFSIDLNSYANVENAHLLDLAGYASLTGDDGANELIGNSWDNLILGGAGNDTLNGGGGDDTLNGGVGNDTFVIGSEAIGDTVTLVGATLDDVLDLSQLLTGDRKSTRLNSSH